MTVVNWLAQKLQSILSSEHRARYRRFGSLCQQLADQAILLSAHDKRMIFNYVLQWRDTKRIGHFIIPSDEHTMHFLGDMVGTIDGILAE